MICLALLLSGMGALRVAAQSAGDVTAQWEIAPAPVEGWTVGDPIELRMRVTYPAGGEAVLPELPGQWGAFEVLDQRLEEPAETESGAWAVERVVQVALWVPGDYETPPYGAHYRDALGTLQELVAVPAQISIGSVLTDDDLEKHDLKPQADLAGPPIWPWIVGGLLLAALLFLGLRWLRGRMRRREVAPEMERVVVDDRPPEVIAHEELDRIAALRLPALGELKRHYTLVTDCVRVYLYRVYGVPAMDRTTGELMSAMRKTRLKGSEARLLRSMLDESDMVKFARYHPDAVQADSIVREARHFVDLTRPARSASEEELAS